jgi:hypothetical protein
MGTKKDIVTIKVERITREKLKAIGIKSDTYDDIICDLLELELRERAREQ